MGRAKLGAKNLFKRRISAGSEALNSEIEKKKKKKKKIDERIKSTPNIYKFGTSKIRINNLKKLLNLT